MFTYAGRGGAATAPPALAPPRPIKITARRRPAPPRPRPRQEGGAPLDGENPFGELWRGGHGEHEKNGGPLRWRPSLSRSLDLFNLPTGWTLGPAAAEVKAESGAKAARFRQENGRTPFRIGNKQKAAVPKGGG